MMCSHVYTIDHNGKPAAVDKRCPYPAIYERLSQSVMAGGTGGSAGRVLPIDADGACLFHSKNLAWKVESDLAEQFLRLVALLEADEASKYHDFTEFTFVGGDVRDPKRPDVRVLRLAGTTLQKDVFFSGASFVDSVEFNALKSQNLTFCETVFGGDVIAQDDCQFQHIDFTRARFAGLVTFGHVDFMQSVSFARATFTASTSGYVVQFVESRFRHITDFSDTSFLVGNESSVRFMKVRFEDAVDFSRIQFRCHVTFEEVVFLDRADFVDTVFDAGFRSSVRYREASVVFKRITVEKNATLTFRSADPINKMFNQDAQFSFLADPVGVLRFENVNFSKINEASRDLLKRLASSGRVEIGSGCIKYRHQTAVRTLSVSDGNAPLVVELCQTFANYFTASNGFNLGFEVVERDATEIRFFYFTDEDITEDTFLDRLASTERSLWNLLVVRSDTQLIPIDALGREAERPAGGENAVINAVDGITALLGTFFRVGIRIAMGAWRQDDTRTLLSAIRFNDDHAADRADSLHRVLLEKYTGKDLDALFRGRNQFLPLIGAPSKALPAARTIILFRGGPEEPTLDDDIYRKILEAIHKIGRGIERSARTYAGKNEEALRDQFVLALEPQFEAATIGEAFNRFGKTDILMRHEGKNIFVAECKIWHGQQRHRETIDQILRYLTWRDSKAAIVYFVKGQQIQSPLTQIERTTAEHPNYVTLEGRPEESWYSYVFHLPGDPERRLQLAVLCFHFPD